MSFQVIFQTLLKAEMPLSEPCTPLKLQNQTSTVNSHALVHPVVRSPLYTQVTQSVISMLESPGASAQAQVLPP